VARSSNCGEYNAIVDELASRIEGTEIQTSSWIPGADWSGTVFHPIYETACLENPVHAAQFFGLTLWDTFRRRPDWWAFGRYSKGDIPIAGLTYFRVDPRV
jgi:hypothetical protein